LRDVFGFGGVVKHAERDAIRESGAIGEALLELALKRVLNAHAAPREAGRQGIHVCPN
jgi:hypothetical protein